jgi:protein-export membrane protein SecD
MLRYRGLIFILILFVIGLISISIPQININFWGNEFKRGEEGSFIGLSLGLDLKGGTHLVYEAQPKEGDVISADDMEGVRKILEKRVNSFGISEPSVQLLGSAGSTPDRILIQLPGLDKTNVNLFFASQASLEQVESLFKSELLGYEKAKVSQSEDGTFSVMIDELNSSRNSNDVGDNMADPAILDILDVLDKEFPIKLVLAFSPGENQSEDKIQENDLPDISKVEEIAKSMGMQDFEVEDLRQGVYQITFNNFKHKFDSKNFREFDSSDLQQIVNPFFTLGSIYQASLTGGVVKFSITGGVEEAKKLIGETALLEFKERDCMPVDNPSVTEWPPDGLSKNDWINQRCLNPKYFEDKAVNLSGKNLIDAFPDVQPGLSKPIVSVVFDEQGGDDFFSITSRIANNQDALAIFLDGEELIAPTASSGISGGRAYIDGPTFTSERVRTISIQLKSGALPVGLKLIQERNVNATLGEDSLNKSVMAGGIGLILVLIFMVSYYKAPGIVASLALILYGVLLFAIFKIVPVTLTLSGAAAVILSIGVAVDANILISERIKEEIRSGRLLLSSIREGFQRAWPSIRDSNISTIITCMVLYWFGDRFGTSVIQGFALTLGIGVILSMFTAYFVSRVLMRLIGMTPLGTRLSLFVPTGKINDNSEDNSND